MDKEIALIDSNFFENVSEVLAKARKNAKTAVNLSMVYAYYEIGKMIVEEEQHGDNRAAYGKYLLKSLSEYLIEKYGKGFSVTNLKQMRQFYLVYMTDKIGQTLSDQFENLPTMETIFYIVDSIDGDYANLRREDDAQAEPKLVARALLPEGIQENSRLKYELLEYSICD